MKMAELFEMTWKVGDLSQVSFQAGEYQKDLWYREGIITGGIDNFTVRKLDSMYSVWDGEDLVAFASLEVKSNHFPEVDQVWVKESRRGEKIFSKLLWFFRSREGYQKLLLGPIHSKDMQEVVKGLKHFDKSWFKPGEEVKPFSLDTLDKFYSFGKSTGWQLMLENDGDFIGWPRFTEHKHYIKESYDWQIE